MANYIEFLERHLGNIEYGWNKDRAGNKIPFNVVKFSGGPFEDTVTYSTIGLSNYHLKNKGKIIRHELFIIADYNFGDNDILSLLHKSGMNSLNNRNPYLRGNTIKNKGKMFNNTELEALYVSIPVYFHESFYVFEEDIPIVQVLLIPITLGEFNFIKEYGWDKFEDILEKLDPDLIDFYRESIINKTK